MSLVSALASPELEELTKYSQFEVQQHKSVEEEEQSSIIELGGQLDSQQTELANASTTSEVSVIASAAVVASVSRGDSLTTHTTNRRIILGSQKENNNEQQKQLPESAAASSSSDVHPAPQSGMQEHQQGDQQEREHHSQGEGEGEGEEARQTRQEVSIEERLVNVTEIYNVELSPTSISIAFDTVLNTNVILKKIFKNQLDKVQKEQAEMECALTCELDHFNLMKGFAHSQNESEFILLAEFVNDADYFHEKVESCHKPIKNELKLKSYMTDVFNGLEYIHSKGYIHCDLKLANLFCEKQESEDEEEVLIRRVKIGDLGLIQRMDPETKLARLEETCGTFGFKAPEVKKGALISEKADIWSMGIILYMMTVAYLPHHMKGYKYGQGPIPFRDFDWKKRSPELKDFVQKCLALDPAERISAKQALSHPFLQME